MVKFSQFSKNPCEVFRRITFHKKKSRNIYIYRVFEVNGQFSNSALVQSNI